LLFNNEEKQVAACEYLMSQGC